MEYATYGITDYKLLKRAVATGVYPPTIEYTVTYNEELRRTGRQVWVCLDLQGAAAGTELTFMCEAYEEKDCQPLYRSRNGRLEWVGKLVHSHNLQHAFSVPVYHPRSSCTHTCSAGVYFTLHLPISSCCFFTVPTDPSPWHTSSSRDWWVPSVIGNCVLWTCCASYSRICIGPRPLVCEGDM